MIRYFKKRSVVLGMAFVLALVIIGAAAMPVTAKNKPQRDVWEWTKKNLNPTWMEWGEKYWPTKPVRGGIYRSASTAYVGMLNPNHWPVTDWGVISSIYEGITAYDGNYNQRVTWLMESWEYKTPSELIMKLKPGVTYHDGTPFNAESLKYTFDWIGDKKNGAWTRGMQRAIKSLEVVDEYTLRWRTHKPWGHFPNGFFAFQISQKALMGDVAMREAKSAAKKLKRAEKNTAKLEKQAKAAASKGGEAAEKARTKLVKARKKLEQIKLASAEAAKRAEGHISTDLYPVGTGPYMYDEAKSGNYIQLKRNPNWWFGRSIGRPDMPYFDGLRTTVIPDPSIQLANLRSGRIDVMYITKAQYSMLKDDKNFYVHVFPSNTQVGMIFNHTGPARDIRVRKAISHAIDRKALMAGTQFGLARDASCYFPSDHWAHNDPDRNHRQYSLIAGGLRGYQGYAGQDRGKLES
ncbi:MAG: ABC transporter substrate-binding protein [Deltaproteobacteria bacterium]|nr:ABC transporter substrate-binding protein [Deltaproteobacteria bacterium]